MCGLKRGAGLIALRVKLWVFALGGLAGRIACVYIIQNTSVFIENNAKATRQSLRALQNALDYFANQVMDHRISLDYLLAEQDGVCKLSNTSCCFYINSLGEAELRVQRLLQRAVWLQDSHIQLTNLIWTQLKSYLSNIIKFLPLLGPPVVLVILILGPAFLISL